MIDLQSFGARFASRRRERGITQRQLATALGVTPQAVSKWERGISFPDLIFFDELADMLGWTLDQLLLGKSL